MNDLNDLNEKEKRELDAFCAERVMGWILHHYETGRRAKTQDDYLDAAKNDGWTWDGSDEAWKWHPTTNPADAMAVLKVCAKHTKVSLHFQTSAALFLVEGSNGMWAEALTAELAIAKFSKILFSK